MASTIISSRYSGRFAHESRGDIDNGDYHGTFQDFRVGVRYQLRTRPLVVTPFVEGIIPSHQYETLAHTAIGRDLRELVVGVGAAQFLDRVLPGIYFQTLYHYSATQRVFGVRPNRSRLDSELGYFVNPRLAVRFLESLQITHAGLNFPDDFESISDEHWLAHDRILKIAYLHIGGGVVFAVTDSWNVYASALAWVWGRNGHAGPSVAVGVSRPFGTGRHTSHSPSRAHLGSLPTSSKTK